MGLGLMLNLIGAMFAYLIGSGFASGQETIQYFSGWGSVWISLGVAVIALLLSCLAYIAYSYAGRTRGLQDLAGIYDFYAGNVLGKLFQVFAWLFNACCYMFMISGFGNVFHQQWGISIPIGSAIGVVLSVMIAAMGLNKIIDIIGKVGPIIVLFTLFIGIVAAFTYYPMIAEGNAAINHGEVDVIRAGSHWVTAGLSFIFIDKSQESEDVVLIDASGMGEMIKESGYKRRILSNQEEETIVEAFTFKKQVKDFSVVVPYQEISENAYIFSAGRYFEWHDEPAHVDCEALLDKIDGHQKRLEALFLEGHQLEKDIKRLLKELRNE